VKVDQILSRNEVVDPDQVASLGGDPGGKSRHLRGDFGRIRAACDDHDLILPIEFEGGCEEECQALLSSNPTVEKDKRPARVDAKAR